MQELQFLFYIIIFFIFIKFLFKNDPLQDISSKSNIPKKNLKKCYIVIYSNYAELHTVNNIYYISDLNSFYNFNPKLKGKLKEIKKETPITSNKKETKKEVCIKEKVRNEINSKFNK